MPITAYLQQNLNPDGNAEPLVHITVPISSLVFSSEDGVLTGGLEVMVVAWLNNRQVGGGVATQQIHPVNRQAAEVDSLFTMNVKVPLNTEEEVILEVRARSLGTSRTWVQHIVCQPQHWLQLPLVFTQWRWNAGDDGMLPFAVDTLRLVLTTASVAQGGPDGNSLEQKIPYPKNLDVQVVLSGRDDFELVFNQVAVNSGSEIDFDIPVHSLDFGHYKLLASLKLPKGATNESSRPWYPARSLTIARVSDFTDESWEAQVEWLEGLVSTDEKQSLNNLPQSKRSNAWSKLWAVNTPMLNGCEGEQEHLLAILEADYQFDGAERGATTDRGRAWIQYGAPDHLEHKGNMQGRYRRWEIWHYRKLGMVLTFLDAHGLDEYRLIETDFSSD